MSYVLDVILVCAVLEEDRPALVAVEQEYGLIDVSRHAGGNRVLQCLVLAGGRNYEDVDKLCAFVSRQPWQLPEDVMLLLKNEHDARPAVYVFAYADDRLHCIWPALPEYAAELTSRQQQALVHMTEMWEGRDKAHAEAAELRKEVERLRTELAKANDRWSRHANELALALLGEHEENEHGHEG